MSQSSLNLSIAKQYMKEPFYVSVSTSDVTATFGKSPVYIAGPCSVEGPNIFEIAQKCKDAGAALLRGGAYKPRTSPYSFQGLEEKGLELLAEAKRQTGLPVVTEIIRERDVDLFCSYDIDMFQIGARNAQNFSLLKEVGKAQKPVLLKRGIACTIEEFLNCAEYIAHEGNSQIVLCERGIRTFETQTRYTLDINGVIALRDLTYLPVIVDPSHATGKASYVIPAAQSAIAAGAQGLEVEVHTCPKEALSDADQALTAEQFAQLVSQCNLITEALTCKQ